MFLERMGGGESFRGFVNECGVDELRLNAESCVQFLDVGGLLSMLSLIELRC